MTYLGDDPLPKIANPAPSGAGRFQFVTPEVASAWLAEAGPNRLTSEGRVAQYARDMAEGRWRSNGEPIVRDSDGRVRDGKHRLSACVKARVGFWTFVVTDVDPQECALFDAGRLRTVGDRLAIEGVPNARSVMASVRLLWLYRRGPSHLFSTKSPPTQQELVDCFHQNPRISEFVSRYSRRKDMALASPAVFGFVAFVLEQIDPEESAMFMEDLISGVALEADDPVYRLRERFIRARRDVATKGTMNPGHQVALIFVAWNHRRNRRSCLSLTWRPGEDLGSSFPIPA
jgi:hypothetical protein